MSFKNHQKITKSTENIVRSEGLIKHTRILSETEHHKVYQERGQITYVWFITTYKRKPIYDNIPDKIYFYSQ